MKDIFEDMQQKIGCMYISDLPRRKWKVCIIIRTLNLKDYSERQLDDFSRYVFNIPFQKLQEVLEIGRKSTDS